MAQVTGIGGVFMKFKEPESMRTWYQDVLGLTTNDYGVLFEFNGNDKPKGFLQLGTFEADTSYFGNPSQQYMINFRVDDMLSFVDRLKEHNVKILNEVESYSYGKFLHIEDPEGNKIELWEPVDNDFENNSGSTMPMT